MERLALLAFTPSSSLPHTAPHSGAFLSTLGSAPAPSPHRAPDLILSPSVSASGHCQHLHHLTRMNSLVSWQLMLLLCATSFRETLEKVAPMETPGPAGMHFLGRGWEGAHELLENEGYHIFQSEASLLM